MGILKRISNWFVTIDNRSIAACRDNWYEETAVGLAILEIVALAFTLVMACVTLSIFWFAGFAVVVAWWIWTGSGYEFE